MSEEYEVGYRKPPEHSRFSKGHSGNPKGRPRGTKNLKTDLREELRETITVREGGRTVRISKQRAILKSMFAKTVKGDTRAASVLLHLISDFALDNAGADADQPLDADELELLKGIEQRLLSRTKTTDEPERQEKSNE